MEFDYNSVEKMLGESEDEEWNRYIRLRQDIYRNVVRTNLRCNMVSEANWMMRGHSIRSGEEIGIRVNGGDIVYADFGQSFLNEVGYQHFALCISLCRKKALVIPMTSNPVQYANAYDRDENPEGREHLMRIGMLPGMAKPSVLFLNDMKYINTARVIDIKAHLDVDSPLFRKICARMREIMFVDM